MVKGRDWYSDNLSWILALLFTSFVISSVGASFSSARKWRRSYVACQVLQGLSKIVYKGYRLHIERPQFRTHGLWPLYESVAGEPQSLIWRAD